MFTQSCQNIFSLYICNFMASIWKKVSEQEKSGKFRALEWNDVSQRAGKIHCVPHIMNRGHHFGQTMLRQRMRSLGGLVHGFMKLNLLKFTKNNNAQRWVLPVSYTASNKSTTRKLAKCILVGPSWFGWIQFVLVGPFWTGERKK